MSVYILKKEFNDNISMLESNFTKGLTEMVAVEPANCRQTEFNDHQVDGGG